MFFLKKESTDHTGMHLWVYFWTFGSVPLIYLSFGRLHTACSTGGRRKARGPCSVGPGTLFLPGGSAELLAPS